MAEFGVGWGLNDIEDGERLRVWIRGKLTP